ncbi:hypothetical protein MVEN_01870100 [Mycena venus]|uniref:Uncharacterized protein n=1 Tax=Mycena venus TaxID=2733690 RepID=A0A8H7CMD2_9AGAR|nr:hypothetical protein MVEN_01870100 [Mycena venus]
MHLSFQPIKEKAAYIFWFETAKSGSDFMESEYARDFKATKHVVPNFATYYTIHSEDKGADGFHEISLTVALIGASKASNMPTGVAPFASGSPNVGVSITQNDSGVSVPTQGLKSPNVSVTTGGLNPSTSTTGIDSGVSVTEGARSRKVSIATRRQNSSVSTTANNSRISVTTQGVTSRLLSVPTRAPNSFASSISTSTGGPTDTNVSAGVEDTVSATQNNSGVSVADQGAESRSVAVATRGPNPFTSTTRNNSRVSVATKGVGSRQVSVATRGSNSSTNLISTSIGGFTDTSESVVTTGLHSMSLGVRMDADVQPIPTGSFILRNVCTNYELTAVIDTSPAMMFSTGQVPVEWRTWKIAVEGSGDMTISNQVKTHRYLQEGASLVETGNPNPVRLIRAVTQSQECYYISTDKSVNQDIVLSDPSPLGVPGGKLQTNVLETNAPQQLWILVPV